MANQIANISNVTNATWEDISFAESVFIAYFTVSSLPIVFGTIFNLWLLCAILTSPDARGRLRNKIICSLTVLNLTNTLIQIPMSVGLTVLTYIRADAGQCYAFSAQSMMYLMQDFISYWVMVSLLVIFIAHILDYNPGEKLAPLTHTLSTAGIIALPWLVSLITVPTITKIHDSAAYKKYWQEEDCILPTEESIKIFKTLDTVIPMAICAGLVTLAVILRRKRFASGPSSMRRELIGQGPSIDPTTAYILAVVIAAFCDSMRLLFTFGVKPLGDIHSRIVFILFSYLLADTRAILMPFPWIFLPDIKERIKTWRPWYRPAPGVDLSVTYGQDRS